MEKITPCLWFKGNAKEAVDHYLSIFDGKIVETSYYNEAGPMPKGTPLVIKFELFGRPYLALNGDVDFPFSEAISLSVDCKDQGEIDRYTERLVADGGKQGPCGWLKDKYGLSWQIVPSVMAKLISGEPKKSKAAMQAMFKMQKLDIATLQHAYDAG
jgi:predicted 3-demethylubiquinone-9 3-methyltransferase (glyoxalase superfamily)